MRELFLSLIAGILCGLIFKLFKLPLPAPSILAGVLGIFGVYLGGEIYDWFSLNTWLR